MMILLKYYSSDLNLFKNIKFVIPGPGKIMKILHEKIRIPGMAESVANYLVHHTPIKEIYYLNIHKMIEYIKITNQILDFKAIQCTNIPEKSPISIV